MTLIREQIEELERELDLLLAGDDNRKVIEDMESTLNDLENPYKNISAKISERKLLLEFTEVFLFGPGLDSEVQIRHQFSSNYSSLVKAWKEDKSGIRQSGALGGMIEAAELYRQHLSSNNCESWSSWRDMVTREISIGDAELESIRNVPEYDLPIRKYKSDRETFETNSESIPTDKDALIRLFDVVESLKSIKGGLKFDLPTKVLKFFDTLDRFGIFPLKEFDLEVLEWLAENDGLKDLSITRRGTSRF